MTRGVFVAMGLGAALLASGCDSVVVPLRSTVYEPAVAAVKAAPDLPAQAVVDPQGNARLYVGKNAAIAVIDYECPAAAGGAKIEGAYTVWLDRVARTWVAKRCEVMPVYSDAWSQTPPFLARPRYVPVQEDPYGSSMPAR